MIVVEFLQWLFQGARGNIVSAVIGGTLVALVTYYLQRRLLAQQLKAQEESHRELMTWLEKNFLVGILTRWNTTFQKEIYPMISPTLDKLDKALDRVAETPPKKPAE
jgi:hypothetical protein